MWKLLLRWWICFWVSVIPAAILALFMEISAESPHWLFKVVFMPIIKKFQVLTTNYLFLTILDPGTRKMLILIMAYRYLSVNSISL